jgi:hypothetical protein
MITVNLIANSRLAKRRTARLDQRRERAPEGKLGDRSNDTSMEIRLLARALAEELRAIR